MTLAVTTYNVVKALHVMAVIAAFGLPLSYPLLLPWARRAHPRAMGAFHAAQHRMTQVLIAPGTLLVLGFGIYLTSKGHYWDEAWVYVPLAIVVIIGAVGGAVIGPGSERCAELAARDVATSGGDGAIAWSAEYEALYRRVMAAETFLGTLVLVAIFFMAAKPFA